MNMLDWTHSGFMNLSARIPATSSKTREALALRNHVPRDRDEYSPWRRTNLALASR